MKTAKSKQKEVYIIYKYEEFKNDYNYIKEYTSMQELKEDASQTYNIKNPRSIYQYIRCNLEEKKEMIQNKYIIIKEVIE